MPTNDFYQRAVAQKRIARPAPKIKTKPLEPYNPYQMPWYANPAKQRWGYSRASTLAPPVTPYKFTPTPIPLRILAPRSAMEDYYSRAVAQNRIVPPTQTPDYYQRAVAQGRIAQPQPRSMEDFYQRAVGIGRIAQSQPLSWEDYYQRSIGQNRPLSELMPPGQPIYPESPLDDFYFRYMLQRGGENVLPPPTYPTGGGYTYPEYGGGGGGGYPSGGGGGGYYAGLPDWMTGLFQLNVNR